MNRKVVWVYTQQDFEADLDDYSAGKAFSVTESEWHEIAKDIEAQISGELESLIKSVINSHLENKENN